ncbi:MAG: hypothetical protein ACI9IP_000868 [Arcticibacterium sp.]
MKKTLSLFFICLATYGQSSDEVSPEPPTFSPLGGFYQNAISLTVSSNISDSIYITFDGSEPYKRSTIWNGEALDIDTTITIRARIYQNGQFSSEVNTQTYFINEPNNLPTISLATDPAHLFSDQTGIYVTGTNGKSGACDPKIRNLNQDWERPMNIEFYEKNSVQVLNQVAGVKIFGGCSRTRFPQKSLSLFARKIYGKGSFKYQLFPDKDITKFESFILRSSGDDQVRSFFSDAFTAYSLKDNMELDFQAYRPVAVFINGVYWGIHNMREKVNEHYLQENFHVEKENINLLEANARTVYGSNSDYNDMIQFLETNELADESNYQATSKVIDINQYIDYFVANIHLVENDWPGNNIKFWNTTDSKYDKWRWILFDRDQTFWRSRTEVNALAKSTATNGPNWPNPPWSTLLLRNLLKNESFKNRFLQTYSYHLSTTFKPERINAIFDEFQQRLAPEMPRHIERWGGQLDLDKTETWPPPTFASMAEWEHNLNEMRDFIPARKPAALTHLSSAFFLNGSSSIIVERNNSEAGTIYFFDKALKKDEALDFFTGLSFPLRGVSKNGFKFSHWDIDGQRKENDVIIINPGSQTRITAHFEVMDTAIKPLVINEINYHSSDEKDSGDWLEIYNPNDFTLNLGGWFIQDGNEKNEFKFLKNTFIDANGYLVICNSVNSFDAVFSETNNRISGLGFGLSNSGEVIKILNSDSVLVDSVHYLDTNPWPDLADGEGSTLELIDPNSDNRIAENWRASNTDGSPGKINLEYLLAKTPEPPQIAFELKQNYPNPVQIGQTKICYQIYQEGKVDLRIFDGLGRGIVNLVDEIKTSGKYEIAYNTSALSPGVYHIVLKFDGRTFDVKKMIVR